MGALADLVVVPGWGLPDAVLAPLLEPLATRWRLHRLPLPAAGTLDDMAERALAIAPPRAAWLGWSLGGMVAARAACVAPARVTALVTVATNLSFVARPGWPAAMAPAVFADFAAQVAADGPAALQRFAGLVAQGDADPRATLRRLRAALAAEPPPEAGVLRHGLAALGSADLRAGVAGLRCPSLWVFGERDALVPVAAVEAIADCVPRARTRIVAGASHAPFLAAATDLAAAIDAFLAETA